MTRTLISLDDFDKKWLDRYSQTKGQSTSETIRVAIKEFQVKARQSQRQEALKQTAGILKNSEDSVSFVKNIRQEWDS